jgi:hypothetical protein
MNARTHSAVEQQITNNNPAMGELSMQAPSGVTAKQASYTWAIGYAKS